MGKWMLRGLPGKILQFFLKKYFLLSINIDLWDCRDVFCRFKVGGGIRSGL